MTEKMKKLMEKNDVQILKKADPVADLTAQLNAIMRYQGLTVWRTVAGVYEVIKDIPQSGDYLDPIPWRPGDSVKAGLWYYTDDKALPHEAIADGYPAAFRDSAYFDFVD